MVKTLNVPTLPEPGVHPCGHRGGDGLIFLAGQVSQDENADLVGRPPRWSPSRGSFGRATWSSWT